MRFPPARLLGPAVESQSGWVKGDRPAGCPDAETQTQWANRSRESYQDSQALREWEEMHSIRGTNQRVKYERRAWRAITQGRAWRFIMTADCQRSLNH